MTMDAFERTRYWLLYTVLGKSFSNAGAHGRVEDELPPVAAQEKEDLDDVTEDTSLEQESSHPEALHKDDAQTGS